MHEIGPTNDLNVRIDEVKAVVTLRSGKELRPVIPALAKTAPTVAELPVKYKDPGCSTISVNIGGISVEKALLDLGASVNLLPFSMYKQLGLGELNPLPSHCH